MSLRMGAVLQSWSLHEGLPATGPSRASPVQEVRPRYFKYSLNANSFRIIKLGIEDDRKDQCVRFHFAIDLALVKIVPQCRYASFITAAHPRDRLVLRLISKRYRYIDAFPIGLRRDDPLLVGPALPESLKYYYLQLGLIRTSIDLLHVP